MANNHETLVNLFTDIADAIREKTGGTENIVADNFPDEILNIQTKEDLDAELTEQDRLLDELETVLSSKAIPESPTTTIERPVTQKLKIQYDFANGSSMYLICVHINENNQIVGEELQFRGQGYREVDIVLNSGLIFIQEDMGGTIDYEFNINSTRLVSINFTDYYAIPDYEEIDITLTSIQL